MTEQIKRTMDALEKNNMVPIYAPKKEDILPIIKSLMKDGDVIGLGGSATLKEIGAIDMVREGNYKLIDRYDPKLSDEERVECYRKALLSDIFLTSTNALSQKGELINVDGTGNRGAALIYGPKSVIVIAGVNKIVENAEEGIKRIKEIAAPKNCVRLDRHNHCFYNGECAAISNNCESLSDGCTSKSRICSSYIVQSYQLNKDRIKVIICGEALGY